MLPISDGEGDPVTFCLRAYVSAKNSRGVAAGMGDYFAAVQQNWWGR